MKDPRRYPTRPLVGAGAVVQRGESVLLLKRRLPPNKGKWALPGGLVELGESVQDAAMREVLEETGLQVRVEGLFDVSTDVHFDAYSKVEYNYVLVDFLATPVGGRLKLNQESSACGWFDRGKAMDLELSRGTRDVLSRFFSQRRRTNKHSAKRPKG